MRHGITEEAASRIQKAGSWLSQTAWHLREPNGVGKNREWLPQRERNSGGIARRAGAGQDPNRQHLQTPDLIPPKPGGGGAPGPRAQSAHSRRARVARRQERWPQGTTS